MKSIRLSVGLSIVGLGASAAASAQTATELFGYHVNDVIRNPTNNADEHVVALIFNPYGLVLTDAGHYLWAGPRTVNAQFTVPAVPAIPYLPYLPGDPSATPEIPERPEQIAHDAIPERTYTITAIEPGVDPDPNDNIDPLPIGIRCTPACGTIDNPNVMPFVVVPPPDAFPAGFASTAGAPARTIAVPTYASDQNRFLRNRVARYGDNGRDGWGVEICIFDCWTIGESAQSGSPGYQGDPLTPTITQANNGPNNGAIVSAGDQAPGISVSSQGGNGGQGGDAYGALPAANGGAAGRGGDVEVHSFVDITTAGLKSYGIFAQSRAGFGGDGGSGYIFSDSGGGGAAAESGNASAYNDGNGVTSGRIITTGDNATGIYVQSIGGGGGSSGSSYGVVGDVGAASVGGNAGNATAVNNGLISTGTSANGVSLTGTAAHGVFAQSVGGKGGNAGDAISIVPSAADARGGGNGGTAIATNGANGYIITNGRSAIGVYAQSVGGGGGDGGSAAGLSSLGGDGAIGGNAGAATANNLAGGQVRTVGTASYGVLAQSIGGGGGSGGASGGISGIGGTGLSGGRGGHATANNGGFIETQGASAHGVVSQSVGGGGGAGGEGSGLVAIGGGSATDTQDSSKSNDGGEVDVTNEITGVIHTRGQGANGILAQSIGGGGGTGAGSGGAVAIGGSGGKGGDGYLVDVVNAGAVETLGADAKGIVAQSIGGGGGSASSSGGVVALGGSGAGGGAGNTVTVTNAASGDIFTHERGGDGIVAQSIGGGGGNGASTAGLGALGGTGQAGGAGGRVVVTNDGEIRTGLDVIFTGANVRTGSWARGILAQSIGGGGGSGGDSAGLAAIGGNASTTSAADTVTVTNNGLITTRGNMSSAIEAQSIGGGGGSGGSSGGVFLTIGGAGGGGGAGGVVNITNNRDLATYGNDSHGIFAQSIGGGGGNGGNAGSMSAFGSTTIGGSGALGGSANNVVINPNYVAGAATPTITTSGDRAKGVLAQSIGGGGGNGGFAANATVGYDAGASAVVGGNAGGGGNAARVEINGRNDIFTSGTDADGIVAQAVGGSGGNGGFAVSFAFAVGDVAAGAFSAGVGGRGGDGGDGGVVQLRSGGDIATRGAQADGIVAQSIGGGGGNGGFSVAMSGAGAAGAGASVSVSVGGNGGDGGAAKLVDARHAGDIATRGDDAFGVVLQSVGGGGGNGGFSISGAVSATGGANGGAAIGVGGAGGDGGVGGEVRATIDGDLTTLGARSTGLVAQSIGGRGGNGGFNISGAVTGAGGGSGAVAVGVGGAGGGGGVAERVDVTLNGDAITRGDDADAVVVQSIGGGGGNGGMNVSGSVVGAGGSGGAVSVGIGGNGGAGGNGAAVTATLEGNASTRGANATAVIAQSLGGTGGNGGMNVSGALAASGGSGGGIAVGVGGAGGGAGNAALATLRVTGDVDTAGANSGGVLAQSLGGGGGNGGMNVSGALTAAGGSAGGVSVGVGGSGGAGGHGGAVDSIVRGDVHTRGARSAGVVAQSLGGGGGNGGLVVSGALAAAGSTAGAVAVGVGGSGAGAGNAARVDAGVIGDVRTDGDDSTGFLAQSLGGGGGNGGMTVAGAVSGSGSGGGAVAVGVGGSAGGGGDGDEVHASMSGGTVTTGARSAGVVAQSLGGGGGNGGMTVGGALSAGGSSTGAVAVGVGGSGGGAGAGRLTTLRVTGDVDTSGENSAGVIAQSVGGGGGNGGMSIAAAVSAAGSNGGSVAVGVGGSGGGGGNGGAVDGMVDGVIHTRDASSTGYTVQSIGGGGGNGAMNIAGALSATGGNGGAVAVGVGGGGGGAGSAGRVDAQLRNGGVITEGDDSLGVLVQSVGGGGGNGALNVSGAVTLANAGGAAISVGVGGSGGAGGHALDVHGDIAGVVMTSGARSTGVLAQSVGGGGGNGGMNVSGTLNLSRQSGGAVSVGLGGFGGGGGNAQTVDLTRTGTTVTFGANADGVVAQSIGGGGGNGGTNVSGAVSLSSSATALTAAFGLGGFGGAGGNAQTVTAHVNGDVIATGLASDRFENIDGISRRVRADGSNGVLAQSVGGSGGNGALNISGGVALSRGSQSQSHAITAGVGGFAGGGGDAGAVTLDVTADLVRAMGDSRNGVTAQSIGGGGGAGGFNVSGGIALDGVITAGVGGFGGAGGVARDVTASASTDIVALGDNAIGFLAQSVGGGGGTGGMNVSGGIQAPSQGPQSTRKPTLVFGIGGTGGAGNVSGAVNATQAGSIVVDGVGATGVLVQSIAGGGGAGGLNVSGNAASGKGYAAAIGIGGDGGGGADARAVTLDSDGDIRVDGRHDLDPDFQYSDAQLAALAAGEFGNGILVQSIGGGGGTGAMNIAGVDATNGNTAIAGVGGTGAGGGHAGAVTVRRGLDHAGLIRTEGGNSTALVAQSIGGGGGNAGMNFASTFSGDNDSEDPAHSNQNRQLYVVAVGGGGGTPGNGAAVDVQHLGTIYTTGDGSGGILAQSIGGGGGNAAYNLGIAADKDAKGVAIAVGGGVGAGGDGGDVAVAHTGDIETLGRAATALIAQSVGGGGGNAGTDLPTSLLVDSSSSLTLTVGRVGGTGGIGGDVRVDSDGQIVTHGDGSVGIFAQSAGMAGGSSGSWGGSLQIGDDDDASQVTVSVGLEGGEGGHAGDVDVHSAGLISTAGLDAYAIQAQSVGGGGGGGGSAFNAIFNTTNSIAVGVGASGGHGATAGHVSVDNDAQLQTLGDGAHGIYAQSTGGGGGVGGYAAQFRLPGGENTRDGSTAIASQVGGNGGHGATGGVVEVTNGGSILTLGRAAFGVNAQSLGGGGGFGGIVLDGSIAGGGSANSLTVNVGGNGDSGGTGGAVTVTNEGFIETRGAESVGIRAQSIGGSGGDAGFVGDFIVAGTSSTSLQAGMRLGGSGGTGGVGGEVRVINRAAADGSGGEILTLGARAHGVFAQSLGGGGGNGSSVFTADFAGGTNSISGGVSIGGTGGTGGIGGRVQVDNDSSIETDGREAHGVFAQSIGGGGGNGGLVLATNAIFASSGGLATPLVALGGGGGSGDDAGDVIVNNRGRIVTRGEHASGILAQSIGGGGGNANIALGATSGAQSTVVAGALSAAFGGRGGSGGVGGEVTVNHSGDITVLGAGAQAVVAESINGGGGRVTLDFSGVASLPGGSALPNGVNIPQNPSGGAADPVIVFAGGGVGQQNSNAGRVHLNYTGTFGVAGDNGAANAVQAIGGGGGTYDLTLALRDGAGGADDVAIDGRLGGVDGAQNRGGDIASTHDGDLVTEGDNTPGALLQSIGGGGGRANLSLSSQHDSIGATVLALGGAGGADEEGGNIDHTQSGSVTTFGSAAHGGVFQSIGGGGGAISLLASRAESAQAAKSLQAIAPTHLAPTLRLGSDGGSVLSGGDVTLALDGTVRTAGDHAIGMLFQSIGAGGGVATLLGVDGLAATLGGTNGARGDGAALDITNTGDVQTEGARAHGVILQSIGGGGGALFSDVENAHITVSSDNAGNGGAIAFAQNGDIFTAGAGAFGIVAQSLGGGGGFVDGNTAWAASAGGAGTAGAIDLSLDGDVATFGAGSTALFAQSVGSDGLGGNITARLTAGHRILGGVDGVAVSFDGGALNHFTNEGIVATRSGPLGFAFRGGAGADAIDNFDTVMGNVDLGGGANSFANHADATFYSGTTVNLGGPANVLRNDGLLSPGGGHLAVTTTLNGGYLQTANARSHFEIDYANGGRFDQLQASGAVDLSGTLDVSLFNVQDIRSGVHVVPLFVSSVGLTDRGIELDAQRSIVITYDLLYPGPGVLALGTHVDFDAAGLEGNRRALGEYLNRVTGEGGPGSLGNTITAAVLETDLATYSDMLTQLGAEFYAEQQALALGGVQRFARNLQGCGAVLGSDARSNDSGCFWTRYDDNPSRRDARAGFPAAEDESYTISQGVQLAGDDGWSWGWAFAFDDHRARGYDARWSARDQLIQFGGSARHAFAGGTVGATLQLGNHSQDVTRLISVAGNAEANGQRRVAFLSNVIDYTYEVTDGPLTFQPSLSVGSSMLWSRGMSETGAGPQDAVIAGDSTRHLWAEPAMSLRYTADFTSGAALRVFARAGVLHYLSGTSARLRSGLEGAPDGTRPVVIGSDLDRTHFVGELGMQYETSGGMTVGLSYTAQESDLRAGGAGSLRVVWPLQ